MEAKIIPNGIVNVQFCENVKIVSPTNLYGCEIGNGCFIGPFVEIQKEDGTFEKVDVELGISDGINVEILEGVKEGDKIKVWNKASNENNDDGNGGRRNN